MINNVNLMGRLVNAPELKTTNSGTSVTSFRIAVDRNFKNKDGNTEADFINIIAWKNTAEFICRYFGKGALIALQGCIQTRQYQDKSTGENRYVTEIVANQVSFTGERRENNTAPQINGGNNNYAPQQQGQNNKSQGQPNNQQAQQSTYQSQGMPNYDQVIDDDDLPF